MFCKYLQPQNSKCQKRFCTLKFSIEKDLTDRTLGLPLGQGDIPKVNIARFLENKHKFVQKVAKKNISLISFKFNTIITSVY